VRTLLVAAGLALGGMLAPAVPALGSHDSSGAPFDEDFAVGAGDTKVDVLDCCVVALDAHSGPAGENPTGEASVSERAFFLGGPITCLAVTGNRAVIGGVFALDAGYLFEVEDNAATGAPDIFSRVLGPVAVPAICPTELPGSVEVFSQPITHGDLVVHDALGTPTSREQCKNGGWKTFGVFKNQGDCLSFVATKGKNPPGR
jgi:hypothetical protein